jgi:hypothetical protein
MNNWPLGNLLSPSDNTCKQYSFSGIPEKGYFEEFKKNRRLPLMTQNYLSFSGIPEKGYFEEFGPQNVTDNEILQSINTNIDFVSKTRPFSSGDITRLNSSYEKLTSTSELPEMFNWAVTFPYDSPDIVAKKKLIGKPDDQYVCGSCWAVSTAGVISDVFVVSGLVNWSPEISSTYALINYPQLKCLGGDPVTLLRDIASGGIPSKHCVDYSWCSLNQSCSGEDSSQHFNNDLSVLVPKEKGCYFDSKHYVYKIDSRNIKTIVAGGGAVDTSNVQRAIKEHIFTTGPAIAGYVVFKNFAVKSGIFTKINGGVYLEKANYGSFDGGQLSFSASNISESNVMGGHAIAVMGWGIQPNVKVGNNPTDVADVPYWFCRNSWGTSWGNGGYFKIAMFPYNTKCQFSKLVDLVIQGRTMRLGGIMAFTVSQPPILKNMPKGPLTRPLSRPLSFYQNDENEVVEKNRMMVSKPKNYNTYSLNILLVILVFFLCVGVLNK